MAITHYNSTGKYWNFRPLCGRGNVGCSAREMVTCPRCIALLRADDSPAALYPRIGASMKNQFIVTAKDAKHGYSLYWTGTSYSRKRESAFRCDSLDFAELSATHCSREMSYLTFTVETF